MPTPVVAVMQQIATDWAAIIPPTDPERVYYHVDEDTSAARVEDGAASGDRAFVFEEPEREEPEMQAGTVSTLLEWIVTARVGFSSAGLSYWEAVDRAATEANLLNRSIERREQWPADVASVVTEGTEVEATEGGDRVAEISVRVTCWETD